MSNHQANATAGATGGRERTPGEKSLLIDVHAMSVLLNCSTRHIWRLADAGKMPRPYKIGALCRWDRAMIAQWIADGCPSCRTGRKAVRR